MLTLLLSRRYTADSLLLRHAALEEDWEVARLQSYELPAHLSEGRTLVYYGETLLADALRESCGLMLVQPTVEWLPGLPRVYLQREVRLLSFAEACAEEWMHFFKPADDKTFPAGVRRSGSELPVNSVNADAPVLVSSVVNFTSEYRGFVKDREIAALSFYDGERDDIAGTKAARLFLQTLLEDGNVDLPPALVIDVGFIEGRGWAVVEANPCWCAGIYECSPHRVLEVLRRAVVMNGSPEHNKWLRV